MNLRFVRFNLRFVRFNLSFVRKMYFLQSMKKNFIFKNFAIY